MAKLKKSQAQKLFESLGRLLSELEQNSYRMEGAEAFENKAHQTEIRLKMQKLQETYQLKVSFSSNLIDDTKNKNKSNASLYVSMPNFLSILEKLGIPQVDFIVRLYEMAEEFCRYQLNYPDWPNANFLPWFFDRVRSKITGLSLFVSYALDPSPSEECKINLLKLVKTNLVIIPKLMSLGEEWRKKQGQL